MQKIITLGHYEFDFYRDFETNGLWINGPLFRGAYMRLEFNFHKGDMGFIFNYSFTNNKGNDIKSLTVICNMLYAPIWYYHRAKCELAHKIKVWQDKRKYRAILKKFQ